MGACDSLRRAALSVRQWRLLGARVAKQAEAGGAGDTHQASGGRRHDVQVAGGGCDVGGGASTGGWGSRGVARRASANDEPHSPLALCLAALLAIHPSIHPYVRPPTTISSLVAGVLSSA